MYLKCCATVIFIVLCGSCVEVESTLDLPEGAQCEVDGLNGTCYNVYNCMSTLVDLRQKKKPKICSFCGLEPIVCCLDCEKVNDTRNVVVDTDGGYFFLSGEKARDKCIQYAARLPYKCQSKGLSRFWKKDRGCHEYEVPFRSVVVGGNDAERFKYPHMALVGYGSEIESVQWLCGGSLISHNYILTAGHCISSANSGPATYVAMGILKRSDPPSLWKRHKVRRVVPHPQYRPPLKYHDIAVLKIDPVKQFSTSVFPACLDFDEAYTSSVTATGWGSLGKNRELADTLQQVHLYEYAEEACRKQYPNHRHLTSGYDHSTQMCYGDEADLKDTCQGDSGGPIQVSSDTSKCLWTIVGVTSYGRACGYKAGDAGMYTRVKYYVPWIERIVWP